MGEKDRLKKVFYTKDPVKIIDALEEFDLEGYSEKETLIKAHMGEINNKYFTKPELIKIVVNALKQKSAKPFHFPYY